jgi:hypothetical protein
MKNRILLLLSTISLVSFAFAGRVGFEDARKVALNAYFEKVNLYHHAIAFNELTLKDYYTVKSEGEDIFYAFNFESLGFILVAAEDAIEPVLGYTFSSYYSPENQSDNFRGVMSEYTSQITYLRDHHMTAGKSIAALWNKYLSQGTTYILPEKGGKDLEPILTSTWNQDWPYNYYCPPDASGPGGHVYVGCVATAMAQVMYYWRYPLQGSGSHSYYQYPYGTLSANFGETTYEWNGMVDNTDQLVNLPVALIGYHCAISVDMNFSPDGSGAYSDDVPYAIRTYFGYSNTAQYLQRSMYQIDVWKGMMRDELDLGRPLYYSGRTPANEGHAFNVDGYHISDDMFHFNFGWSGSGNGWYLVTDAGGFTLQQGMIRNFFPASNYPYYCTTAVDPLGYLTGTIEDGSGPVEMYQNSANCSWLIDPQTAQDSVTKITFSFIKFDTETSLDVLTLYDGSDASAPVLGSFSGATLPSAVTTTGNKLYLTWTTNASGAGQGWLGYFKATQPVWCTGLQTLTTPTGVVEDGSGSFNYNNVQNCMWKIQPPFAFDLTLSFNHFETEANEDVVKIYDASNNQLLSTLSGQYTPGNMPPDITIASGKAFITFQSSQVITYSGWEIAWVIGNVGVQENVAVDRLKVYPNPAEDLLNISFFTAQTGNISLKLASVTGMIVYEESLEKFAGNYANSIDISQFNPGVYFLNITSVNGTENHKVVVR